MENRFTCSDIPLPIDITCRENLYGVIGTTQREFQQALEKSTKIAFERLDIEWNEANWERLTMLQSTTPLAFSLEGIKCNIFLDFNTPNQKELVIAELNISEIKVEVKV